MVAAYDARPLRLELTSPQLAFCDVPAPATVQVSVETSLAGTARSHPEGWHALWHLIRSRSER